MGDRAVLRDVTAICMRRPAGCGDADRRDRRFTRPMRIVVATPPPASDDRTPE